MDQQFANWEENKAWSLRKRRLSMPVKDALLAERICQVAKPQAEDVSA